MSEEAVISVSPTVPIKVHPWAKRFIVWCLSFTAFVLSCVAVGSCKFVKLARAPAGGGVSVQYFGLFQAFAGGTCISIDLLYTSLSSSAEAARAFGVLASLFGGFAMLGLLSMFCIKMDRTRWRATGFVLIACSVFQVFTFIIFDSPSCKNDMVPTKCNLDEGGACSICAMFFYIFAAVGVFLLPVPNGIFIDFSSQPYANLSQNRQNTITEVINADGSKTVFVTRLGKNDESNNDKTQYEHDEENPSVELEKTQLQEPPSEEKFDNEELDDAPVNPFQRKKQRKPLIKESLVQKDPENIEENLSTPIDENVVRNPPAFQAKFDNEESEDEDEENRSAQFEEINEKKPLVNKKSDDEESEYEEESDEDDESDAGNESDEDEEDHSAYHEKKERTNQIVEQGYDSEEFEDDDYNLSAHHERTNNPKSNDDDDTLEDSYERSLLLDDDGSSSRKMATQASDEYEQANDSDSKEYRYSKAHKEYKNVRTESV